MNILLTGTTGFFGTPLVTALIAAGHTCTVATRAPRAPAPGVEYFAINWDAPIDAQRSALQHAIAHADAVINLAGESVGVGRWTAARKAALMHSRLRVTHALVEAMAAAEKKPRLFLSASGTGYYGDGGDTPLTELAPRGRGFLADMAADWEAAAVRAASFGVRAITLRFGVILAHDARMLQQLIPLFRAGLGGPVGSGRQYLSWIHCDDAIALVLFALAHPTLGGPVNAVAPEPITNTEFSRTLAHAVHRRAWLHTPAFVVRLLLGERAALVLDSQRAIPHALTQAGFTFRYPQLTQALAVCV